MKSPSKLEASYGKLLKEYQSTLQHIVESLIGADGKKILRFPSSVYVHFINDNLFTDLRQISSNSDGIKLQYEIYSDGAVYDEDATISELDLAGLFEVVLALREENYRVDPSFESQVVAAEVSVN